jgi:hypothetical protein
MKEIACQLCRGGGSSRRDEERGGELDGPPPRTHLFDPLSAAFVPVSSSAVGLLFFKRGGALCRERGGQAAVARLSHFLQNDDSRELVRMLFQRMDARG